MLAKILVALDGSARAPDVFEAALEVASRFAAVVYPFRAIFVPPEFPAAAAGSLRDPLPAYLAAEALEDLDRLTERGDSVQLARAIVRVGHPWRLILEVSEELAVDLIVLGSHGYHAVDRILGTTAARVANMARRNVLVVHPRADKSGGADLRPGRDPYR